MANSSEDDGENGGADRTDEDSSTSGKHASPGEVPRGEEQLWEEEIDLREVGRGILHKWPIWVGIPLAVMVLVGSYFLYAQLTAKPRFEVTAQFTYRSDHPDLTALPLFIPDQTSMDTYVMSTDYIRDVYPKLYPNRVGGENPSRSTSRFVTSALASNQLTFEYDTPTQRYQLQLITTVPDSGAQLLNEWLRTFERTERARIQSELNRIREQSQNRLDNLQANLRQWQVEFKSVTRDTTNPDLLRPVLAELRATYDTGVRQLEQLRTKMLVNKRRLQRTKRLLRDEPEAFRYPRDPDLSVGPIGRLLSQIVSGETLPLQADPTAEHLNPTYVQLRKQRAQYALQYESYKQRVQSLSKKMTNIRDKINRLERRLAGITPTKEALLEQKKIYNRTYKQARANVTRVQSLLNPFPEIIRIIPASGPGRFLPPKINARRNTLLSGAVTFLALFFGVAFWEIL